MRKTTFAAAMTLAMLAAPLAAQTGKQDGKQDKPITQREPNAVDVVATPVSDLNLRKGEIPPILLQAQDDPYTLAGMRRCPQIAAEVGRLDAVLGDDIDIAQAANRNLNAGRVAQSVVGSFIPFRGIIRELSGANESDRRVQAAIYGGSVRRSFLKGVGLQRGCSWPARPATAQMLARLAADNEAKARKAADDKADKSKR